MVKNRRFWILPAAALMFAGTGCAAVKATQQPDKKDLAVLSAGVPRTNVIAELGAPVWTEQRGETTSDIFSFKQGYSKEVKAGRALVHGAGDVLTMGLWEVVGIPAETLADGTDVKLEVTYDAYQNVESVKVLKGDSAVHPKPLFAKKTPSEQPADGEKEKSSAKLASFAPWTTQKTMR